MVASQLSIYNEALLLCEERILATVNDNTKSRRLLDVIWNDGGVNACLQEAMWSFATRTVAIQFDPNIQPQFGYIHAFKHPDDFVRSAAIASDPYFMSALTQYNDEDGYWWCDLATLFVKYVSNDPNYGNNMPQWPESFKIFVAAHFADKIVKSLTHDDKIQEKVKEFRAKALISARSKDAMNEPPGFFPRGQLSRARQGMYFGRPNRTGQGWY